jgi:molybdate transport system ATP-binding protein
LAGRIEQITDDESPGLALVRVRVGESALLARVTYRALAELDLRDGDEVWVQVKSVALAR